MSESTTGRLEAIFLAEAKEHPMTSVPRARAIEGRGLEGCRHTKRALDHRRQVLLVDAAAIARLDLPPGTLKENFLVSGVPLDTLMPGQRIALGDEVVVELTLGCVPCQKLERIRPGLLKASWGQRGQLGRVLVGGEVQVGDTVRLLDINPAVPRPIYPKLPG